MRSLLPPFRIPNMPSSQPLITFPFPTLNLKDLSELVLESKTYIHKQDIYVRNIRTYAVECQLSECVGTELCP